VLVPEQGLLQKRQDILDFPQPVLDLPAMQKVSSLGLLLMLH
jgi:hypothetical protein